MTIIKVNLSKNTAAIYNKAAQEPYIILDAGNADASLINKIEKSTIESGVIYYAG